MKIVAAIVASIFALPLLVFGSLIGMTFTSAAAEAEEQVMKEESKISHVPPKSCSPDCSGVDGPQGFDVNDLIAEAFSDLGNRYSSGYAGAPGECIVSVQRWINAVGGHFGGGGARSGYINSGAMKVSDGSLRPGDVVQWEYKHNVEEFKIFGPGQTVHTYLVTAVNRDGTHNLIESNYLQPGTVEVRENVELVADSPAYYQVAVWRFGKTPGMEDSKLAEKESGSGTKNS